jgi:TetR/AcrR family transcriptional regulator, transcriptional repressor for nem operon
VTKRPPKPPEPAETDTRERILEAAADAWHRSSFDGVGTAELCRLAKVHKGSFFHFFASKDDLLLAVLDRHAQRMRTGLRDGPFRSDVPPLERFEQFFGWLGGAMREQKARTGCMHGCPIGNLVLELATRDPKIREAAARVFDELQAVFAETLDQAIRDGQLPDDTDTAVTAATLLVWMQGLAVVGKAYGDAAQLRRIAASVAMLLRNPPRRPVSAASGVRTRRSRSRSRG